MSSEMVTSMFPPRSALVCLGAQKKARERAHSGNKGEKPMARAELLGREQCDVHLLSPPPRLGRDGRAHSDTRGARSAPSRCASAGKSDLQRPQTPPRGTCNQALASNLPRSRGRARRGGARRERCRSEPSSSSSRASLASERSKRLPATLAPADAAFPKRERRKRDQVVVLGKSFRFFFSSSGASEQAQSSRLLQRHKVPGDIAATTCSRNARLSFTKHEKRVKKKKDTQL